MGQRIGIDIGSTFTDVVLFDDTTGEIAFVDKVLSDSEDLLRSVSEAVSRASASDDLGSIELLMHGSTVGINTLLERSGSAVALVTTKGFKDVYEIGRQWRGEAVYDVLFERPPPLIPRERIFEVAERMDANGEVVEHLGQSELQHAEAQIRQSGADAVAICLLFGFANPEHEEALAKWLTSHLDGISVTISSHVCPEFREYERTATTLVDAYIKRTVQDYLHRLGDQLERRGLRSAPLVMRSSGGLLPFDKAAEQPVDTLFSGPVGGVMGAVHLAKGVGWSNVLTVDTGGTSTDVALVVGGDALVTKQRRVEGHPVNVPMVEVLSVGSGGGSIAWLYEGSVLKVGPHSAGANPGPACYGRGGEDPTLTDAFLVLGFLPEELAGGQVRLDSAAATKAIANRVAEPLGISVMSAAQEIIDVAIGMINDAVRLITVERGHDPQDFMLMSYGGATSIMAGRLASEVGIRRVGIPPHPGVFSAFGLMTSDIQAEASRSFLGDLGDLDDATFQKIYQELEATALSRVQQEFDEAIAFNRTMHLRYSGQSYEVPIGVDTGPWDEARIDEVVRAFHEAHEQRYGSHAPDSIIEHVTFSVEAVKPLPKPMLKEQRTESHKPMSASARSVGFPGREEPVETPIYRRMDLKPGAEVDGPAVIEEFTTSVVVYEGQRAEVDPFGTILIESA